MQSTLCALGLFFLLVHSISLSQADHFSISPLLSFDSFHTLGFDSGFSVGLAASIQLSSTVQATTSVAYGKRSSTVEVVGGTEGFSSRIFTGLCTAEVLLLGQSSGSRIAATVGVGGILSSVDARDVSIGGFGHVSIPARSSTEAFAQAGLLAGVLVSPNVLVEILPALRRFTPFSSSRTDVSLAGGLRVGIF